MNLDFDLDGIRDYLRENWLMVLAIAIIVLLLLGYLIFTLRTLVPRWQLHTELSTAYGTLEAAYADRVAQQQSAEGQMDEQIEVAQGEFAETANHFLTEEQGAAFLARLYDSAADTAVTIVELQAQPVPPAASTGAEKPVYDTRQFLLQVAGELIQLNEFVGRIEQPAIPGVSLENLLITPSPDGQNDLLTLNVLLYTSPFSTGASVAELPEPLPLPTLESTAVPTPIPTPAATAAPDVSNLVLQLDEPWTAENWPEVIRLIQEIRQLAPSEPEMLEKLYAARVNYGYQLAAAGDAVGAAEQFEFALAIFPEGAEAEAGLQSLFAPTATVTPTAVVYIVQRGDTLYSIARRYGSTVDAVKAANGLANNNISPGQQLIIP